METVTRAEHIRWAKQRAREYLKLGDPQQAVTSMLSDLGKHEATKGLVETMGMIAIFSMRDIHEAERFVEGFNE